MDSARIRQIQEETAYPNSISVMLALKKVWNECAQKNNEEKYTKEEVLEHLNLLFRMRSSHVDTFTDENEKITMKWFTQFKNKKP